MELPDIPALARKAGHAIPAGVSTLTADERRALGEEYLKRAARPAEDRPALLHRQAARTTGCSCRSST